MCGPEIEKQHRGPASQIHHAAREGIRHVRGRMVQGYSGALEPEKNLDLNPYSLPDEVSSLVSSIISQS